jgi:hypothetical protein
LLLEPLASFGIDECLRVLKHIVSRHARTRDLAIGQRIALAGHDDADLVVGHVDRIGQRHGEEERVDAIDARRYHRHLRTSLAAICKERACVLEGVAIDMSCDDTAARERLAVAGLDAADLALRNGQELLPIDRELPRPEAHVESGRQRVRLESGLAIERDNPAVREPAILADQNEFLSDDSHRVVGDDDHTEHPEYEPVCSQQHRGGDEGNYQISMTEDNVHDAPFA